MSKTSRKNYIYNQNKKNNPFKDYEIPLHLFDYEFVEGVGGLREPAQLVKINRKPLIEPLYLKGCEPSLVKKKR